MSKIKEFETTREAIRDFKEKQPRKIIELTEETAADEIILAPDVPDEPKHTVSEEKTHSSVDKSEKMKDAVKKKTRKSKHETARTIGEVKKLRTAISKTTGKTNGIRETEYFPLRSYYFDEDTQSYEEIDTSISEDENIDAYKTGKGYFSAKFPRHETEKEELFSFEEGMHKLTMYAKRRKNQGNTLVPRLEKGQSDRIVFEGFSKDTDIEYFVGKRGVKENIVINNKRSAYRYAFLVECENLVPVFIEHESRVVFNSSETGEEIFNIPAPYMVDAAGVRTNNVFFEVKPMSGKEKNTIQLSVIADSEWINAEGRAFPVRIDPSANCSNCGGALNICGSCCCCSSCGDTYVVTTTTPGTSSCNNSSGTSDSTPDSCACGSCGSGSIDCTINTENVNASSSSKKYLTFTESASCQSDRVRVVLYVNSDCSGYLAVLSPCRTICRNNVIIYTFDITEYYGQCNSFRFSAIKRTTGDICSSTCCPDTETEYCPDDTTCNENTNCDNTNCDDVCDNNTDTDDSTCDFCETTGGTGSCGSGETIIIFGENSAYPPSLIVKEDIGFEGNSAVIKQDLGRYGVGAVDIYRRNMLFAFEDFSWDGNRMPVTIQHMYNGIFAATQYTNNESVGLNTADFSKMKIGNGWKLNLMQSMVPVTEENGETIYIYTTASGKQIEFTKENSAETESTDPYEPAPAPSPEPTAPPTESTTESNTEITEEDIENDTNTYYCEENSKIVYNASTKTLSLNDEYYYVFDTTGKLISIKDKYENTLTITYTNGKISSVTDGVGREFTFNYSSGTATASAFLTSIVAPDDSVITFTYNGDYLHSVTYPGRRKTVFTEENGEPIIITYDEKKNETAAVKYTYGNTTEVNTITEYGTQDNARNIVCTKKLTTESNNRIILENGVHHLYHFDHDGVLIGHYSKTTTDSYYKPANFENSINLLSNHRFEEDNNSWIKTGSPEAVIKFSDNSTYYAHKALEIHGCEIGFGEVGVYQSVHLEKAGTYTFSAFVKVFTDCEPWPSTRGVFLRICREDGSILVESERIKRLSAYNRLWVPFTIEEAENVTVHIIVNGDIVAYVTRAQLEPGNIASSYNLIENGAFNHGLSNWSFASKIMNENLDMITNNVFQSEAILPDGYSSLSYDAIPNAVFKNTDLPYQTININSSESVREVFLLSGWSRILSNNASTEYYLQATINYEDETINPSESYFAYFDNNITERQFSAVMFAKSQYAAIKNIQISCCYKGQEGVVYFDNIQLTRQKIEIGLTAEDFASSTTTETTSFEEHIDEFGNQITDTVYDENASATIYGLFGYDPDGNNLISYTDGRGNKVRYSVDEETSLVTSVENRCNEKTVYSYDDAKRVKKISNKDEANNTIATAAYDYDSFDNITRITRGDGMEYSFEYNKFRQPMSIAFGKDTEAVLTYEYNDNGKLKKISFANGETLSITYNNLGQVISETVQDAESTTIAKRKYVYDAAGNVVRTIDFINKKEYTFTYSDSNLLRVCENIVTISNNGDITSRITATIISYSYDEKHRLSSKRVSSYGHEISGCAYHYYDDDSCFVVHSFTSDFSAHMYHNLDKLGRVSSDAVHTGTINIQRDFTYVAGSIPQEYSELEKVKSAATTNLVKEITITGAGNNRTLSYEYDAEERITKVTDSNGSITEYTYDAMGQLLTETVNGEVVNSMTYDSYGNILTKNGIQYEYDSIWKDKLVRCGNSVINYDAQGNPILYRGNRLIWKNGRLVSNSGITYEYNFDGIRTSKTVYGVKHTYLLEGTRIVKETWEDNELIPVYDASGNVCGIGYNGTPYFFVRNLQGDVLAITDRSGNVLAEYTYDAWGKCTVVNNLCDCDVAEVNPFRYRGYYYDTETRMYYLQSRYYDPEVGRFISADNVECLNSERTTSLNLYCYCVNNPISYADPSGHLPFFILTAIIGAVIGIVITAAVDYIPDKEFNLHWGWYLGAGVLGAAIGAGIGMAISYYATGSLASSTGKVFSGLFGKTTLYRSVGPNELSDIQKTGKFRIGNASMDVKQFGLSLDETRLFGQNKIINQTNIVVTEIPNRIFYRLDFTTLDVGIFKHGTVTVTSAMLDAFNNSLLYIAYL